MSRVLPVSQPSSSRECGAACIQVLTGEGGDGPGPLFAALAASCWPFPSGAVRGELDLALF